MRCESSSGGAYPKAGKRQRSSIVIARHGVTSVLHCSHIASQSSDVIMVLRLHLVSAGNHTTLLLIFNDSSSPLLLFFLSSSLFPFILQVLARHVLWYYLH